MRQLLRPDILVVTCWRDQTFGSPIAKRTRRVRVVRCSFKGVEISNSRRKSAAPSRASSLFGY